MIDHDKYRTSLSRSKKVLALLLTTLFYSVLAFGQKPEYDFYPEFRNTFTPRVRAENPSLSLTNEDVAGRYAAKLRAERVTESEITRRTKLILTERNLLEADYWNRYYLDSNSNFNRAPNGFLKQMVEGTGREWFWTMEWGRAETLFTWRALDGRCGASILPMLVSH